MGRRETKLNYAWRVFACGLGFSGFGLSCIVYSLLVFPLIRLSSNDAVTVRRRARSAIQHYFRAFIWTIKSLGVISYEIREGQKLLRPGQLIVANHPSLIDVALIISLMPDVDVGCIVKKKLLHHPILRWPIQSAHYFTSTDPGKLIDDCAHSLMNGRSLIIFPEGTRSTSGNPLVLQRGAAHIALAANCDILPITIHCTPPAFTKTDSWYRVPPRRPHWCLDVGEPIRPAAFVRLNDCPTRAARDLTEHLRNYFSSQIGIPTEAHAHTDQGFRAAMPTSISHNTETTSRSRFPAIS